MSRWVWQSIRPGRIVASLRSTSSTSGGDCFRTSAIDPTALMRPLSIKTPRASRILPAFTSTRRAARTSFAFDDFFASWASASASDAGETADSRQKRIARQRIVHEFNIVESPMIWVGQADTIWRLRVT